MDLCAGWWHLPSTQTAGVPKTLAWVASERSAAGARQPELTSSCPPFRGVPVKVYVCKPADPEPDALERLHDHLEKSFLPGWAFTGPEDFEAQP